MTTIFTLLLLVASAFTAYFTIAGKTCHEGGGTIFGRLTLRGWIATFCIVVTAFCGVSLFFLNSKISAQRDSRQKRIDELAMESRLPNEEGMHAKELLALERNAVLISKSKDGAGDWINGYLKNMSEEVKKHVLAEQAKEALANELHLFWLPHIEVLIVGFRDRAKVIANEYSGKYSESLPNRFVKVAYSRTKSAISSLSLPSGYTLTLFLYPGIVSETERIPPHLIIKANTPKYNVNALSFTFNTENALQIANGSGPFEKRFEPYSGSKSIVDDHGYIDNLNLALNSVFEIWLSSALNQKNGE